LEGFRVVIKYVAEQNPRAAAVKAEEIVDSSWLKKLDSEGFSTRCTAESDVVEVTLASICVLSCSAFCCD